MVRVLVVVAVLLCSLGATQAQVDFTARPVVSNLHVPWDMVEGPDGYIWYTERIGLLCRVHPDTGVVDTLLDMRDGVSNIVEIGLLSLALHPAFPEQPYVYAAYGVYETTWVKRVTRWRYDGDRLVEPLVIYEKHPADQWHQGCRILILPDTTMLVTSGDKPAVDSTMNIESEVGKSLRINLDGSIPADNPFPGKRIWSMGHRNAQGICRTSKGSIFSSEHGDNNEDEINLITPGSNYGWPKVAGMCDTPEEKEFCAQASVVEPVWSSGTVFTLAPAGIEYYGHDRYPALKGKLISTFLKGSRLLVHDLNEDHTRITATRKFIPYRYGRIRDVLVTSTGRVFVCTGNVGMPGIEPFPKPNDDVIVELLPVWDAVEPRVRTLSDTIVMRANPGDTLRSGVMYCSDGTPVNFTRFFTNPGNVFDQRFWQDGASTEDTTCYWFRVHYKPQTDYPYTAEATAFYTALDGSERGKSVTLVGLPNRGMALPVHDTTNISKSVDAFAIKNIGLENVVVTNATVSPLGAVSIDASVFPLTIPPGETRQVFARLIVDRAAIMGNTYAIALTSNGVRDTTAYLRIATTSSVEDDERPFVISPNPATNVVRIQFPNVGLRTIQIHDALGRLAYTATTERSELTIPTSLLGEDAATGMYLVRVSEGTTTHTSSFIVTP